MNKINKTALVVLSGGQDSVTCLGYALARFENVQAISFNYSQRHAVELICARDVCEKHSVPHRVVDMGTLLSSLVTSALTGQGDVREPHAHKAGLPASFVPGRNALFLTLAHAYAQEIGAEAVVTGVCQTDYSGYPDCREQFVQALGFALNTGYETKIQILAPLMNMDKADTFRLAEELGFLSEVIHLSHTCYNGDHTTLHEWGYGCGECPACQLRAAGFAEFKRRKAEGIYDESPVLP